MFVKVTRNCVFGYWLYDMSDADHPEQGSVACFTTKGGGVRGQAICFNSSRSQVCQVNVCITRKED